MAKGATAIAGWRDSLLKSLEANKEHKWSTFFQLATIRKNGRPANRTLVFRGFIGDTCKLTFTTDSRSVKLDEAKQCPLAEICWYFTDSREQYRMSGKLVIVDKDEKDEELKHAWLNTWRELSTGGRAWFMWPDADKLRTPDDEEFKPDPPGQDEDPLPNYCLGVLDVDSAEHLLLRENHRLEYHSSKGSDGELQWEMRDMNP